MKQAYIILIITFSLQYSLNAQQHYVDSLFSAGNNQYGNQEYTNAIASYKSIVDTGYNSAELFLNLGNAYIKNGQYAHSILYYEKALLLDPGNEDIQFNLKKAQAYTIDKIESIPEFFLIVWGRNFISLFPSNTWAIVTFMSFAFAAVFVFLYFILISRSKKVATFTLGLIFLSISLLSFLFSVRTKNYIENSGRAIILTSTVTVKGSPDFEGVNVFIIHEGTKVNLLRSIGEWYEINLADGKQGWIKEAEFEKI
jgi:tetratricopeptide (TPR) repeat protein